MKAWLVVVALGLLLQGMAAPAQAESAPPNHYTIPVLAVLGVITATTANFDIGYPTFIPGPGTYYVSITASVGVVPTTLLTLIVQPTTFITPGCTAGSLVIDSPVLTSFSAYIPITVAAGTTYCAASFRLQLQVTTPLTNIAILRAGVEMGQKPLQAVFDYGCGANGLTADTFARSGSQCLNPQLDNENRFCAASTFGAACTPPALTTSITSWPSLSIASLPTVNVAGTMTNTIAAWPTLNANVGITSWPSLNIASVPTLTVTDNVHVLDWPTMNALVNGTLHLCGQAIAPSCSALELSGFLDTNSTTIIGNQSAVVNIPAETTVHNCGPIDPTNVSRCTPLQAEAFFPGSVDAPNLPWLGMLVFLSILVAVFWYMGMAFALGWSVAAFIVHILPGLPFSLPVALLLIVIGVTVQYLNERRGERSQAPEDRDTQGVV